MSYGKITNNQLSTMRTDLLNFSIANPTQEQIEMYAKWFGYSIIEAKPLPTYDSETQYIITTWELKNNKCVPTYEVKDIEEDTNSISERPQEN